LGFLQFAVCSQAEITVVVAKSGGDFAG
jgi:hypothetical protein